MKKPLFLLIALVMLAAPAAAQHPDLVWRKETTQEYYMVKFSTNGDIIVAHGYDDAYFFDAETGEEIGSIPFNAEVHFINDDQNYIQLAPSRDRLVIYDTQTYEAMDTLDYDGTLIGDISISDDEQFIAGVIENGLRTWDLQSGQILNTKKFPDEENLIKRDIVQVQYDCDGSKLYAGFFKTYNNPQKPNEKIYKSYVCKYDSHSLDSIDAHDVSQVFRISNTCKYIAYKTGGKYEGVEVYDFATKELLYKLPLNGPSLTGIEFSPDDKCLVTASERGQDAMKIWNLTNGEIVHEYPYGAYPRIDVSPDGQFIVSSIGRYVDKWYAYFDKVSVDENDEKEDIIYPNPTTNSVTIKTDCGQPNVHYQIIDAQGRVFAEKDANIANSALQIDFTKYPAGSYLIRLFCGNEIFSYKVIKID